MDFIEFSAQLKAHNIVLQKALVQKDMYIGNLEQERKELQENSKSQFLLHLKQSSSQSIGTSLSSKQAWHILFHYHQEFCSYYQIKFEFCEQKETQWKDVEDLARQVLALQMKTLQKSSFEWNVSIQGELETLLQELNGLNKAIKGN